jgi:uncharacterized membrane protein
MTTVYSSFQTSEAAEKAIGALLDHGVDGKDVSVLFHEGYETAAKWKDANTVEIAMNTAETGITTTTAADAGVGAAKGAGYGFGIGALAALACVFIPGVGIVLGGGALAVALGATAAATGAGAIAGGVTGYLKDQGIEPQFVEEYASSINAGGAVVSVMTPSNNVDSSTVSAILAKYGSTDARGYPSRIPVTSASVVV